MKLIQWQKDMEEVHLLSNMPPDERKKYEDQKRYFEEMYNKYLNQSLHDRTIIKMILQYEQPELLEYILERERIFYLAYGQDKERLLICMSHKGQKVLKQILKEKTK